MAEYIERDIAAAFAYNCGAVYVSNRLSDKSAFPSANVAPVRHGRWIESQRLYYGAKQYECSLCWAEAFWDKHRITEKYPCCPNCGAVMEDANA